MKCVAFSLATVLAAGWAAHAADQPQWGQRFTRNMVSDEKGLPASFDPASGKNIKWSVELGSETYGSPIVANGRVFIGTNNRTPRDPKHQGDRGVLMCLDEKDGRLLWQLVVPKLGYLKVPEAEVRSSPDVYLDWPGAGLCSPPTVEGDRVYVVTNRNEIVCLDIHGMANGNDGPFTDEGAMMTPDNAARMEPGPLDADVIWRFDLVEEGGIYPHDSGFGSILLVDDLLYVNSGNGVDNTHRRIRRPDAPSLVVLDKKTGRFVARDRENMGPRTVHCTWSSPAIGDAGGRTMVIFGGGDGVVYAFEPVEDTGEFQTLRRIWRFDCDPDAPTDDVHNYMGNRKVSASNIKSMPVLVDGRVYVTVGGDIWWGKRKAWLKCIDAVSGREVWSYELSDRCCSTPSIAEGLVYVADAGRMVHCVDARTGRAVWTHQTRAEMWASTMVADGKVFIGTRKGDFHILAAGREKKVLAEVEFGEQIAGTATAANGVIYVAAMTRLWAIQEGAADANVKK